jgi:hypothetical protein
MVRTNPNETGKLSQPDRLGWVYLNQTIPLMAKSQAGAVKDGIAPPTRGFSGPTPRNGVLTINA